MKHQTPFTPIMTPSLQNYRVIITEKEDRDHRLEYEVWTGNGVVRYLYPSEMPDEMSNKLAIVKAYGGDHWKQNKTGHDFVDTYTWSATEEYQDIGWRVNEECYCLVLSPKTLNSLRGETLDDSGSKSESESKENS